jgi:hypothetical protein
VQRSGSGRQAARLTFAVDDAQAALEMLDRYAITSSPSLPDIPRWEGTHTVKVVNAWWEQQRELGAVHYDRAVYLAATGDLAESTLELHDAGSISPKFFLMATTDMQLLMDDELAAPVLAKLGDALRDQQEIIASQAERARALPNQIAEFDSDHQEISNCRHLVEYVDHALVDVCPRDPPRLRLDELLLRHLEEVVRLLYDQDASELQYIIEEKALALAAKSPGFMARPSLKRTVSANRNNLQVWEVEQPRSGFMRTPRIWLISTDGIEATVTQLH